MGEETTKEEVSRMISLLWAPLTEKQTAFLADNITLRHFAKNDCIYQADMPVTHMKCLIRGKAKIFKDGIGGKTQIIRVIKPIEFFGYRAFFANECYQTSGFAMEKSTVALIPMTTVMELIKQNHHVALFLIKQLSTELGASDQRTVHLSQKHVRARLAEAILFMKDSYGYQADEQTLSIALSREDLANLSNMTTSNAIRTLSAFAAEELVQVEGRKIRILAEDKLERISKLG